MGGLLLVVILAHAALITIGYAGAHGSSVLDEAAQLFSTYPAMISAVVAIEILVAVGVLAIGLRRAVPYEVWYLLHLSGYAVLLMAYGHQFANGEQMFTGLGRQYWTGLYVGVIACLVEGRLFAPIRLNLRHRLRVDDVVLESPEVFSLYVTGRRLDELEAKAGQFFRWRFLARGCWWQAHPFSLSAAPNGQWLRVTIKTVGHHTARLSRLRRGTRVFVDGPSGIFTADRAARSRTLLIAGGTGITPIRALLEELPQDAIVIYRASTNDDLIFRAELDRLAWERGTEVLYSVGSRRRGRGGGVLTARGLRQLVPDVARRDVYVCGPGGLVEATVKVLKRLRVPDSQLHLESFEF